MDCEIFDKLVIDRVFLELDDLASGAVQRHVAHCSRCRSIESSLRATREVAILPSVDPSTPFVDRVLAVERAMRTKLPMKQRLGRAVSVLAGYAMRPQLGMSALLFLMIGSSLFLLRAHPNEHELVQVTERGVPEGEIDGPRDNHADKAKVAAPSAVLDLTRDTSATKAEVSAPNNNAAASAVLDAARRAFAEERYGEAQALAERVIADGGSETAPAALLSALALARRSGCSAALARFEALRARHGRSAIGEEAAYRAAECHLESGQIERARPLLEQLRNSSTWGARARERLGSISTAAPPTEQESSDPATEPQSQGLPPSAPHPTAP
ncbi:MAG: hypothetical protein QM784_12345 [Polyangiaceae bacterium]